MDAMIPIRITQITISMVVKPERRMTVSSGHLKTPITCRATC